MAGEAPVGVVIATLVIVLVLGGVIVSAVILYHRRSLRVIRHQHQEQLDKRLYSSNEVTYHTTNNYGKAIISEISVPPLSGMWNGLDEESTLRTTYTLAKKQPPKTGYIRSSHVSESSEAEFQSIEVAREADSSIYSKDTGISTSTPIPQRVPSSPALGIQDSGSESSKSPDRSMLRISLLSMDISNDIFAQASWPNDNDDLNMIPASPQATESPANRDMSSYAESPKEEANAPDCSLDTTISFALNDMSDAQIVYMLPIIPSAKGEVYFSKVRRNSIDIFSPPDEARSRYTSRHTPQLVVSPNRQQPLEITDSLYDFFVHGIAITK